jgi:hypothetical protein
MEEGRVDGSSGENRGGDPSNPRASTQIRASAATVVMWTFFGLPLGDTSANSAESAP